MRDFIETIFHIFTIFNQKANNQNDRKMKLIALMIFNYVLYLSKEHNIQLSECLPLRHESEINLSPLFQYIDQHAVQLYNFQTIQMEEVDLSNKQDLERFVLTHLYYVTQNNGLKTNYDM
jgi:hypothetical protein